MELVMKIGKRRSVKLTTEEKQQLRKYINTFPTVVECAEIIGIHRNVLDRVILSGSGSPETIGKVRSALGNQ